MYSRPGRPNSATTALLAGERVEEAESRYSFNPTPAKPQLHVAFGSRLRQSAAQPADRPRRLGIWLKKNENTISGKAKLTVDRGDYQRPYWRRDPSLKMTEMTEMTDFFSRTGKRVSGIEQKKSRVTKRQPYTDTKVATVLPKKPPQLHHPPIAEAVPADPPGANPRLRRPRLCACRRCGHPSSPP